MSYFGPALPPSMASKDCNQEEDQCTSFGPSLPPSDQGTSFGPSLPPSDQGTSFGPSLPPSDQGTSFGPSLPPSDQGTSFGPSLPPSDQGTSFGPSLPPSDQGTSFGPSLPADMMKVNVHTDIATRHDQAILEEELTDDIIGPLPPSHRPSSQLSERDTRKHEIESRMKQMKNKLNRKNEGPSKPVREEWMMELPPEINPNIGATSMTSRKFRTKYTEIGDRSVWTDTPADKARKALEGNKKKQSEKSDEEIAISKRDQLIAQEVDEYNKQHRGTSLVELHRKRKAETQSVDNKIGHGLERRPFDRDIDLQMPQNIMTNTKRRALIKDSAKSLDSKFARGKQQFL